MGDVILTLPVVENINRAFPDTHITYMAEYPYSTLLYNHPGISHIIEFSTDIKHQMKTVLHLVKNRFDIAIDLFGNPRSALLVGLSGANRRIGGDYRGRSYFYTDKIKQEPTVKTAIEFHLSCLAPLDIQMRHFDPEIFLAESEKEKANQYLYELDYDFSKPIIGIYPGATWPAKIWPPERFADLINQIVTDLKYQVLLTMGPGDEDIIGKIIEKIKVAVPKPQLLTLRSLAAVLSRVDLFISNDCGPMHIAPAVHTKTIGLFGPGEPEIWFPYSRQNGHQFIHKEIDCSRCHRDFCDDLRCMRAIKTDEVIDLIDELMAV